MIRFVFSVFPLFLSVFSKDSLSASADPLFSRSFSGSFLDPTSVPLSEPVPEPASVPLSEPVSGALSPLPFSSSLESASSPPALPSSLKLSFSSLEALSTPGSSSLPGGPSPSCSV